MIYVGMDPGSDGAIAIINKAKILIYDIPALPEKRVVKVSGKKKYFREPDRKEIIKILKPYSGKAKACIELVHFDSRDDDHKVSAEILIRSQEIVATAMECLNIPYVELLPIHWRKAAGCSGLTDPSEIVRYALTLYPEQRKVLKRQSSRAKAGFVYYDGRAESLLMAHASKVLFGQKFIKEKKENF